jgi:hypothetical protein
MAPLKILEIILTILAWTLVLALIYAIYPYVNKVLEIVQRIHDFAH